MYEFSSKSQQTSADIADLSSCWRYCKCTSFQANHNLSCLNIAIRRVVGDTANVRVFKQITTKNMGDKCSPTLLAILQMYEFSSKSQLKALLMKKPISCLRYCKCTSFQANHNLLCDFNFAKLVVCDTANVRVFKQITTCAALVYQVVQLLAILQMYEFSSKSQRTSAIDLLKSCCWRYCKCTSFQANHNKRTSCSMRAHVVCDTANVRVFKQITTSAVP